MALIKCSECSHDVSTEAKICPNCGAKVKYKKPTSRTTWLLGGLFAAAIIGGVTSSNSTHESRQTAAAAEAAREAAMSPEQKAQKAAAKAKHDAQIQQAAAGALALKRGMKDPTAFELTSLVLKTDGSACYDYRAKNTFGAILPSSAVVTSKGKLLLQERDKNAFVKAWNDACTKDGGDDLTVLVKRTILE
ncbi:MAG: zinc ribbon domain-containing protein [Opitutaceae bacterium]|jgi:DNA-directed RNA polymerase subunit RPC12/RpoP|nr:zinc ribbon domain-containing protein [Opitutaceae bacterium]